MKGFHVIRAYRGKQVFFGNEYLSFLKVISLQFEHRSIGLTLYKLGSRNDYKQWGNIADQISENSWEQYDSKGIFYTPLLGVVMFAIVTNMSCTITSGNSA